MQIDNINQSRARLKILLTSWATVIILSQLSLGCKPTTHGVTFLAPRGNVAAAQTVSWSPTDPNKMLVAAYQTPIEPTEIYVLDLQTRQKQIVLQHPHANIHDAIWMPDGKDILILVGGDTQGFERLGWWKTDLKNANPQFYMPPHDIAWSPDGITIAQLRKLKPSEGTDGIALETINSKTKAIQTISRFDGMDSSSGISWSPEGKYLAFGMNHQKRNDLYIVDVESGQVTSLTTNGKSITPAWSPKGDILAYVERTDFIHLTDRTGQCDVELPTSGAAWSPTWSPDGTKIAYVAIDGIYVLDLHEALGRDVYQGLCP